MLNKKTRYAYGLGLKEKRFERELTIAIKQTNSFWEARMYNK